MRPLTLTLLLLSSFTLAGCDRAAEKEATNTVSDADQSAVVSVADPLLAIVGGTELRDSQLKVLMSRLPNDAIDTLTDETRHKMTESLVRMRAIALEAERLLSDEERLVIDAKVDAFRDELLAKEYLSKNVSPAPVSQAMVLSYYEGNSAEFTEAGRVDYKYLSVSRDSLDDKGRKKVITAFGNAKNVRSWSKMAAKLKKQGIPAEFKRANIKPSQIAPSLAKIVKNLKAGGVSDLVYGEQIIVVKVINREAASLKPLSMVSADIRKMLAPLQLKKSLRETSQQIVGKTEIEYVKGG